MDWKTFKVYLKKAWHFIWHEDSFASWIVNIVLAIVIIKFLLYPGLGLALGTKYPVVAVVSNSMEHEGNLDDWWNGHRLFYSKMNITKEEFQKYPFTNGFNKGDIMVLLGKKPADIQVGDIIVFRSGKPYPIIHRVVVKNDGVFETKGDHNQDQIKDQALDETNVHYELLLGKAVFRIPYLGYIKIWFVDAIQAITSHFV
jgi:signal peptidase I